MVCILSCCLPIALTAQSFSTREQAFQYQFEDILSGELADTLKLQFFVDRLNDLSAKGSTLPIKYAQKGIALAQITGNPKWKGLIQIELGWIYQRLNKIALAEEQYQAAIDLFTTVQLPIELSKAHSKLSLLYGQTQKPDLALQQARTAIQIAEKGNNEIGIAYGYYAIVYNFINSGKSEAALPYVEQSIQLYQKHNEIYRIAVLLENKVTCYLNLGRPQEALATANELIAHVQENKIGRNHPNDRYLSLIHI